MNTHVFELPSGIECEVKELTGKHQKMLTEQNKKPHNEKMAEMLADCIVRVGDNHNIDLAFVKDVMLSADKKAALVELRQFSLDFEEDFTFLHTYKDIDGNKQEVEITEEIPNGRFPMRPLHKYVQAEGEEPELVPAKYNDYSEIQKEQYFILPKSGLKVRWNLLDGKGEAIGNAKAKNQRSSHLTLEMRRVVYFEAKESGGETPVLLNFDKLGLKDIEALRAEIKRVEGAVDTEIMIELPDSEFRAKNDKHNIVDVLSMIAFFFPSEAI